MGDYADLYNAIEADISDLERKDSLSKDERVELIRLREKLRGMNPPGYTTDKLSVGYKTDNVNDMYG